METEKWKHGKGLSATILIPWIHCLTFTLLSLHLPLSFLLMARLTPAHHLLTVTPNHPKPFSIVIFFLTQTNPPFLHTVLLFVSSIAVVQMITSRMVRPGGLHVGWTSLCLSQLCVGLGIEATTTTEGILLPVQENGVQPPWAIQVLFFVGLYEITVFWARVVVKPMVDDTTYGKPMAERLVDRVALGAAFGSLWWWRLRREANRAGVAVEMSRDMEMVDLLSWLVYHVAVVAGFVRLVSAPVWVAKALMARLQPSSGTDHHAGDCIVEKV